MDADNKNINPNSTTPCVPQGLGVYLDHLVPPGAGQNNHVVHMTCGLTWHWLEAAGCGCQYAITFLESEDRDHMILYLSMIMLRKTTALTQAYRAHAMHCRLQNVEKQAMNCTQ
jgi:hypothetical protein